MLLQLDGSIRFNNVFSTRSQPLYSASWRDHATWVNHIRTFKAPFERTNGSISVQPHKSMQQFQTIPHNKTGCREIFSTKEVVRIVQIR